MGRKRLQKLSRAFAALVAETATRVVAIRDGEGATVSGIVWREGLVIAAHEALDGDGEVAVTLPDGREATGTVRGRDPSTDVALVAVETGPVEPWRPAKAVAVGALALVVGRGEGSPLASHGIVGEAGPAWRSLRGGEIDARITLALRITSRLEGGAVVDAKGRLIGMAASGPGRRAIVIPAATIERAAETLNEKGYIPRGYLGATLHPIDGRGVIVVGVAGGGPAESAGLAIGDVITTWDGATVSGYRDLLHKVAGAAAGQSSTVGVLRGGNAIDLQVVIGERPRP